MLPAVRTVYPTKGCWHAGDGRAALGGSSPNTKGVGSDAVLLVKLGGTNAPDDSFGLRIDASGSVVRAPVIKRWDDLDVNGANNAVLGTSVGTDASGTLDRGNGGFGGVLVDGDGASNADAVAEGGSKPSDNRAGA